MDTLGTVEIITFSGCDTAQALISELDELKKEEAFDLEVIIVPSAADAHAMHLYGSPTIRVNGLEYQKMDGGNPGFY